MATPRFYWYPTDNSLRVSGLTSDVTDVRELPVRDEVLRDSGDGRRVVIQRSGHRAVTIRSEMIGSAADAQEMEALINHIRNRHVVAFAEDDMVTFSGFTSIPPPQGATSMTFQVRPHVGFGALDNFTTGAIVVIKGQTPQGVYIREEQVVQSWDGTTLTFTGALINDYSAGTWCFVHDKRFHPYLRLRADGAGRELLTHDRRITWTLDLPMEELPYLVGTAGGGFGGDTSGEGIPANWTVQFFTGSGYGGLS